MGDHGLWKVPVWLNTPICTWCIYFCLFVGLSTASQASEESKPVGAYRPPAYRAPGRRAPVSAGRKMPEIDSEIAFPSLSAAMASNDKKLVGIISDLFL